MVSSKCSSGHVECRFDNPAENSLPKPEGSQSPKIV